MWYQLYIKQKYIDPNAQQIETVVMKMVWVCGEMHLSFKKNTGFFTELHFDFEGFL